MDRWFLTRLAVMVVPPLLALCAGLMACARWWPLALSEAGESALPGLRVDGAIIAAGEPVHAWVAARTRALLDRRVRLVSHDDRGTHVPVESTLGALGVWVDVDAVTARALSLGRTGDMLTRAQLADAARRGGLDVPLQPRVDPRIVVALLLPIKEDLDVPPVLARLDFEQHRVIAERDGHALDIDGTISAIARAAVDSTAVEIELPFAAIAPHVTSAALAAIDVSRVVASFATYFSRRGNQAPRAQNIEAAASHVDGLVIEPGEMVSFNDLVGARSGDNGFQKAFEIYKGEMVEGTGGGTCQVASTLHAVAFFGGLDIVQRLPHSRPSAYIPVGLDATVVYPIVDLKVRNPYNFPVVVRANVGPNKITMQLLGADKPARIALMRTVLSTTPFDRKIEEDPSIGKPKRKQKGLDGLRLLRKRLIVSRNGASRVETSRDTYPPTTEIWKVPPSYDENELPLLGEDLANPDNPDPMPPLPRTIDPEQTIWGI
ncbi:MAG: VanW family protein [Myxococcota bacterium]|nr:VanW family protein [Myxococcota bacterium]